MKDLYIYGYSDDCIEVDGAISDEFNSYGELGTIVVKSDGATIAQLTVEFDPDQTGEWRITVPEEYSDEVTIARALGEVDDDTVARYDENGCPRYSDKAILSVPDTGVTVEHLEADDDE